MIREKKDQKGFSLIELMVAMAVFSLFAAGLYSTYYSQVKAHTTQRVVVEMQQNIRNSMYLIERDLRMAGYNLLNIVGTAVPGIKTADRGQVQFTMDIAGGDSDGLDNDLDGMIDSADLSLDENGSDDDGDGLVDESDEADEKRYGNGSIDICDLANSMDDDGDGLTDEDTPADCETIAYRLQDAGTGTPYPDGECVMPGPCNLVRNQGDGSGWQLVAANIDALNFVYLDVSGNDLTDYTTNPPAVPASQIANIRSVQISIVARSGAVSPALANRIVDDHVYTNQRPATENSPWHIILPAQNDNFRRSCLTSNVLCRNLGI